MSLFLSYITSTTDLRTTSTWVLEKVFASESSFMFVERQGGVNTVYWKFSLGFPVLLEPSEEFSSFLRVLILSC
uniref:Uncharacterized protein n=1 Tax=Salix viminalis TaxID=40686 RepID=A0A6N2MRC1_SALVM